MKRNVLFLTVGLLALSGNVFADISETFSHTTTTAVVPFTDNFTLTSFDTNLGTLESITIGLATTGTANVDVINFTNAPQSFTNATVNLPLTVTGPLGITVVTNSTGGPISGTVAGPMFAITNFPGVPTSSSASLNVDAGLFSEFESVGPTALNFSAVSDTGHYSGTGTGVGFGGSGDISGVTSVTYTYEASTVTPEPALWGVVSLCLGGVVLVRRRNLKKS